MATVKMQVEIDDDELWSMIFGAAAGTWSWWRAMDFADGCDWNIAGECTLVIENPDYDEDELGSKETIEKVVTVSDLAAGISALDDPFVYRQLKNEDFDADGADRVLQFVVLGAVAYG